jgi:hypothetical protein
MVPRQASENLRRLSRGFHRGLPSNLSFWRGSAGNEIDVLLDQGERLVPIAIKAGTTLNPDYFSRPEQMAWFGWRGRWPAALDLCR